MDPVTRPDAGDSASKASRQTPPKGLGASSAAHQRAATDPGQHAPESGPPTGGRRGGRASLATLASNPRLPVWERRIAIAVVVGIAVTFVFGWRIGITVAILAAISDAIYRSHSAAVVPPTRSAAQRKTERRLAKLTSAGYLTLNERAIPGSDEVIDHLVVGPTGTYAIDSEQWDKRLPIRVLGGKQLFHGPFDRKDRLAHAKWEAAQATELIHRALGRRVTVRPSLAIYGPKIPWDVLSVRNVDVFSADQLRKYLRRSVKAGRGTPLSRQEIDDIYAAAARVLPPRF